MNKRQLYILENGRRIVEGRIRSGQRLQSEEFVRHYCRLTAGIRNAVSSLDHTAITAFKIAK